VTVSPLHLPSCIARRGRTTPSAIRWWRYAGGWGSKKRPGGARQSRVAYSRRCAILSVADGGLVESTTYSVSTKQEYSGETDWVRSPKLPAANDSRYELTSPIGFELVFC